MGAEDAGGLADHALNVGLPVFRGHLVLHKLQDIFDVGPELGGAEAGNLGLHHWPQLGPLLLLAVLEVEVDRAQADWPALCVFEEEGLELGVVELGGEDLVDFDPALFAAEGVPAVDPQTGLVEQGPQFVGGREHPAAPVQQHVLEVVEVAADLVVLGEGTQYFEGEENDECLPAVLRVAGHLLLLQCLEVVLLEAGREVVAEAVDVEEFAHQLLAGDVHLGLELAQHVLGYLEADVPVDGLLLHHPQTLRG